MESNEKQESHGTFGRFMLLFIGFIALLVGLSYLVTAVMK
jgi:hypothetical protein